MTNLRKRVYPKRVNDLEESKFHWNYVSNRICGIHVRNSVRQIAHSSHTSYVICHLHNLAVSSWCNTTLAPPAPYRTLTRNLGYNRFAIMLGTAGIRLKNSLCRVNLAYGAAGIRLINSLCNRRDYVITRRDVQRYCRHKGNN